MEIVKLSIEDWGLIAPGRVFDLGNTTLKIKALPLGSISDALLLAYNAIDAGSRDGITAENWSNKKQLSKIIELMKKHCPSVVTIACGLDGGDFKNLPGNYQIDLIVEILEENQETIKSAIKNSEALVGTVTELIKAKNQAKA